jgi:L-amino acid N-acyltransferase YncA
MDELQVGNWLRVKAIYQQGIDQGDATFELATPDWVAWNADHLAYPRLIALTGDLVVGWAALSPVSERCVYEGVAEVSVYVDADFHRRGIGKMLLQALIKRSEKAGLWTLRAGVFPENAPSLSLHKSCGFRVVGVRERIGQMSGVWRDVILLERRSSKV